MIFALTHTSFRSLHAKSLLYYKMKTNNHAMTPDNYYKIEIVEASAIRPTSAQPMEKEYL